MKINLVQLNFFGNTNNEFPTDIKIRNSYELSIIFILVDSFNHYMLFRTHNFIDTG